MKPNAPVLISPVAGAPTDGLAATFLWEAASQTTSYRVQIATDTDFEQVAFEASVPDSTALTVYDMMTAFGQEYYWRVQSEQTEAWSASAAFMAVSGEDASLATFASSTHTPVPTGTTTALPAQPHDPHAPLYMYDITESRTPVYVLFVGLFTVLILTIVALTAIP